MIERIGKSGWNLLVRIMHSVVYGILGLCHKDLSDKKWQEFLQFVKFGLVGVSNTLVSYLINVFVLIILHTLGMFPRTDYFIANIVAFILSVLWSFYWNNKYVFKQGKKESRNLWRALFKTYLSYIFTGVILSNVLSYVWIEMFDISKYIAPLINSIIGVPINFVLNKFWAFKSK